MGHGLTVEVVMDPIAAGQRRSAGSFGWDGAFGTHFWVDPTSGICGSIYSNFLPFVPQEALDLYANFEKALYASR